MCELLKWVDVSLCEVCGNMQWCACQIQCQIVVVRAAALAAEDIGDLSDWVEPGRSQQKNKPH